MEVTQCHRLCVDERRVRRERVREPRTFLMFKYKCKMSEPESLYGRTGSHS